MTIDRLIRIFAGSFILISLALGVEGSPLFISRWALAFTAFVGANLLQSALTKWFNARFAKGGTRPRRLGIVAVARKLLIALWHYVEHGIVPEGAILKEA